MNTYKIPETPNTNNEPLMTVAQAVKLLSQATGLPPQPVGVLSKLGRDASMAARAMGRPTGMIPVVGQRWDSEKTYTLDVLKEVFRRNPITASYYAKVQS